MSFAIAMRAEFSGLVSPHAQWLGGRLSVPPRRQLHAFSGTLILESMLPCLEALCYNLVQRLLQLGTLLTTATGSELASRS
mmetsp:Transcript_79120/g.219906  ORF Transcript_79120/g.219906 Transcript_79120/m.219906 type:complete len:81 (+) Transcript_79120:262-504(+)